MLDLMRSSATPLNAAISGAAAVAVIVCSVLLLETVEAEEEVTGVLLTTIGLLAYGYTYIYFVFGKDDFFPIQWDMNPQMPPGTMYRFFWWGGGQFTSALLFGFIYWLIDGQQLLTK